MIRRTIRTWLREALIVILEEAIRGSSLAARRELFSDLDDSTRDALLASFTDPEDTPNLYAVEPTLTTEEVEPSTLLEALAQDLVNLPVESLRLLTKIIPEPMAQKLSGHIFEALRKTPPPTYQEWIAAGRGPRRGA